MCYSDRSFLGQPKSFSIQLTEVHIIEGGFCGVFWGVLFFAVVLLLVFFWGGRVGFGGSSF